MYPSETIDAPLDVELTSARKSLNRALTARRGRCFDLLAMQADRGCESITVSNRDDAPDDGRSTRKP
jgi:hypothetical protein